MMMQTAEKSDKSSSCFEMPKLIKKIVCRLDANTITPSQIHVIKVIMYILADTHPSSGVCPVIFAVLKYT